MKVCLICDRLFKPNAHNQKVCKAGTCLRRHAANRVAQSKARDIVGFKRKANAQAARRRELRRIEEE